MICIVTPIKEQIYLHSGIVDCLGLKQWANTLVYSVKTKDFGYDTIITNTKSFKGKAQPCWHTRANHKCFGKWIALVNAFA